MITHLSQLFYFIPLVFSLYILLGSFIISYLLPDTMLDKEYKYIAIALWPILTTIYFCGYIVAYYQDKVKVLRRRRISNL